MSTSFVRVVQVRCDQGIPRNCWRPCTSLPGSCDVLWSRYLLPATGPDVVFHDLLPSRPKKTLLYCVRIVRGECKEGGQG
jgi:hypothetical protein